MDLITRILTSSSTARWSLTEVICPRVIFEICSNPLPKTEKGKIIYSDNMEKDKILTLSRASKDSVI